MIDGNRRGKVAMGRRYGPSPEARETMRAVDADAQWVGTCRRCKIELKGKLAEIKEHKCDGPAPQNAA